MMRMKKTVLEEWQVLLKIWNVIEIAFKAADQLNKALSTIQRDIPGLRHVLDYADEQSAVTHFYT
jgi:hypothetical protein